MVAYAVRRLGMAPCTKEQYEVTVRREKLVAKGDKEALRKFDEAQKAKLAPKVEPKKEEVK